MSRVQAPAPGDPSAQRLPSEPANQDLSPGKPGACQFRAAFSPQPWSQARAGRAGSAGAPCSGRRGAGETGRPLIFFACGTGSSEADNMGQGLQGSLDCSHHGPGRMWLSPARQLLLSPGPLADDTPVKGPAADSTCQLLSGWRLSPNRRQRNNNTSVSQALLCPRCCSKHRRSAVPPPACPRRGLLSVSPFHRGGRKRAQRAKPLVQGQPAEPGLPPRPSRAAALALPHGRACQLLPPPCQERLLGICSMALQRPSSLNSHRGDRGPETLMAFFLKKAYIVSSKGRPRSQAIFSKSPGYV